MFPIIPWTPKLGALDGHHHRKRSEDEDAAKYGRRSETEDAAKYGKQAEHEDAAKSAKYISCVRELFFEPHSASGKPSL